MSVQERRVLATIMVAIGFAHKRTNDIALLFIWYDITIRNTSWFLIAGLCIREASIRFTCT